MTDEEKRKLEEEFARLRKELDSAEGQAKVQGCVREEIRKAAKEHAQFLARSRERGFRRVVRGTASASPRQNPLFPLIEKVLEISRS